MQPTTCGHGQSARFQAVVCEPLPDTPDFHQSRRVPLRGLFTKDAAWQRVFAAMKSNPALVSGHVEEVH